jgi:hypothetical protein
MSAKKDAASAAIDELFGDTSVPKETTLEELEELQSDVESKIDCLKEDIKRDR